MKKEVKITVPVDYSAINLRKYITIQNDLESYSDDSQAQDAFLLYNLCGITPEVARALDNETVEKIKKDLYKLLNKTDYELQKFITIDNVEYGFEPNLSQMAYGAYLDISKIETLTLDKNWPKILSILYRPVKKKQGALYEIENYNSDKVIDSEKWYDVNMDFHFGAFFFFNRIYLDLLNDIRKSLMEEVLTNPNQPQHIKSILRTSGEVINQLQSSQTMTSLNSRK